MSILKTNKTIWFTCPYMICYTSDVYTENKQNYLIYLSLYDLLYFWCLYWKQTKLSDLPVLIWLVILLMSTENKQNYLIYLSLYDLLYFWCLYWKQTKLSDLPVLIWFVILLMSILKTNKTIWFTCPYMICYTSDVYTVYTVILIWFVILMSILKTNKTIWFTCPYMICYTSDVYTENKQNYLIYLSLYDLLYFWCLYWKQTKLSDLPVLIWFVIHLMSILKTNKTIWFTCPYMICYTSDVYTENKQNYLIYLSLYDLLYFWCLYWKQTKLSDLPVLIWFVILLMSILKTNKTIWFTCPYMTCYTSDVYTENKQNYLIYLSLYDLLYIWGLYWKQTKLSDLPVLIWFVIHLMSILKTNKTIWFTCLYMICYTSDVYTVNKQNYLIYLSLYDLLYIWCLYCKQTNYLIYLSLYDLLYIWGLYWKQTKLSDLPVLIWFVIHLRFILKTNKTIWFTCPYMICYTSDVYTENKQNYLIYLSLYDLLYIWCLYCKQTNYLIYLSLYDLLYFWCLYWKQTKLSDLPVLIWFVILLMSILKTNKTIWFTCPYMICYTSDVYTENKQNYLIYLSLYDLLYIWCLYWKQTKLSDLPVLIWFVILLMSILKTNKTIWFTCPYMTCYTSDVYTENKQNYLIYLSLYDLLYIWGLYWKQTKLSDLPVLIWFVIHLMSILKTNKTIWFTCLYMICYTSDVYTVNKQNYLIYLSLYDLLYIWCLYWKQTKLSDLPVLIWFVIHLMSIL